MILNRSRAGRWLLKPNENETPLSVGILGWIVLLNGIRISIQGISGETAIGMWPSITVGGCLVAIAWTVITGRPIGLAGGFLSWSSHLLLGFFGILESGTLEDEVDFLLGIMVVTILWVIGIGILYRNRDFFLKHAATESEPVE